MNPSFRSWWCHGGHQIWNVFQRTNSPPFRTWAYMKQGDEGKWGLWQETPCRPALFMYGAVKTHNFQAPVGLSATVLVTGQHYCHRGQILFGVKLGLCSLLFNFCTSSFTQVFILTRKYTLTCTATGFPEEPVQQTQCRKGTSLASWVTFKIRHRIPSFKM